MKIDFIKECIKPQLFLIFLLFICTNLKLNAQETVDVDQLFNEAILLYRANNNQEALQKTNKVLQIAPEYRDARVLRIRVSQRLKLDNNPIQEDIIYLLKEENNTEAQGIAIQHINYIGNTDQLTIYKQKVDSFFDKNKLFPISLSERYIQLGAIETAKPTVNDLTKLKGFTGEEQYRLQQIIKAVYKNRLAVNHEILSFLEEYPIQKSWNTTSLEYQRYIGLTSLTARVNYSKRFFDDGMLYQLESYPVLSKNLYFFASVSYSDTEFFQNYGVSLSGYYNIGKGFEVEGGFRYLEYDADEFFSTVLGLTKYTGNFYINARAFLGPKTQDTFIQNYQLNLRYYLNSSEDYLSLRLGTGISPDDQSRFTQINSNPDLIARYGFLGINKSFKKLICNAGIGYLYQDLSNGLTGNQITSTFGIGYRF